jgi:hypothetical protein
MVHTAHVHSFHFVGMRAALQVMTREPDPYRRVNATMAVSLERSRDHSLE